MVPERSLIMTANVMKKWGVLIMLWLSFTGGSLLAENPKMWNRGELFLTNGEVLEGELNYNWKAEIVQLRHDDVIKAYSAHQVKAFSYLDNQQSALRKFVTAEYPVDKSFSRSLFLEEFVSGSLTVYRRLRHMHELIKSSNPAIYGIDEDVVKDVDNFDYFVSVDNNLISLTDFPRDLWPRMRHEFNEELNQFALRMQINTSSTLARLLLINQYNHLKTRDAPNSPPELRVSSGN